MGYYFDANNAEHGFLATSVPEPSTLVVACAWAVISAGYWWHRRGRATV